MKLYYRFKQLILLAGDLIAFTVGFWIALMIRTFAFPDITKFTTNLLLFFFLFLLWIIVNYISGLYDLRLIHSKENTKRFIETAIFALIVGVLFFYIYQQQITPKTILVLTSLIGYTLAFGWRYLYSRMIGEKTLFSNIFFLGLNNDAQELIHIITQEPGLGYRIAGVFDEKIQTNGPITQLHTITDITSFCKINHVHTIVASPEMGKQPHIEQALYRLLFSSTGIVDTPSFYESVTGRIPPSTFSESWFLKNIRTSGNIVYDKLRRFSDIILALLLGVVLLILFPFIALLIKYTSSGPVLFKQTRIGKNDKEFYIYKFRTMFVLSHDGSAELEGAQLAQPQDVRVTSIGKLLRKTRIDELPQAINMFKGDITLIGPRPERPEIVAKLTTQMPYYPLRNSVKPGLTGWAQIHQHYTDTLETTLQKLQYDLFYIKNRSFLLDLSILLKTINVLMRGMGQ